MATRRKKRSGASGGGAMDMLSYASLMTILLTFFIMLSSFAKSENEELLQRAMKSVRRAFSSFGLSAIMAGAKGRDIMQLDIERFRANFPEKPVNNIYLEDEGSRNNLLEEDIEFQNVYGGTEVFVPARISFKPREYEFDAKGKRLLDDFIRLVKDRPAKIIIEGRAGADEMSESDGFLDWYLSSYRAHSVAEYLHSGGGIDARRLSVVGYGKHRSLIGKATGKTNDNAFVNLIVLQ